jgi:hypothetical protein
MVAGYIVSMVSVKEFNASIARKLYVLKKIPLINRIKAEKNY